MTTIAVLISGGDWNHGMIAKLVYPRWILWFIVAILDIMPR
jgi:hypothetical protein